MSNSATPLASRELVVVTGKGGVGKSSLAAAIGKALAGAGRKALVLEIDPRESVHQMFAHPPSGGEVVEVEPGLYLQNLQALQVLDQLVRERLRFEALSRRVLESPVYRQFVGGGPGLKEMAVLGHALRLVRGEAPDAPRVDVVVLDAPATGHGVSLLAAPLLVAEVIQKGPIGKLTRQVAELVRDPERTGIVAVTLAEEMPVTEALELAAMVREQLQREPDLLAVNGLYPPVPAGGSDDTEAEALWRMRRRLNEAELERLRAAWPSAWVELPLWPLDRGRLLVERLAEGMALALGGEFEAPA